MFFSLQKLWRFNIRKLVGAAVKKTCKKSKETRIDIHYNNRNILARF
jgi:hypothetical protein